MVLDRIDALEKAVAELTARMNSLHEVQKQVAAEQKEAEAVAKAQAKDMADAEAEAERQRKRAAAEAERAAEEAPMPHRPDVESERTVARLTPVGKRKYTKRAKHKK